MVETKRHPFGWEGMMVKLKKSYLQTISLIRIILIYYEVCFNAPSLSKLNRNLNTSRAEIAPYPFIT
jgi:hypothetical protein